MPQSVIRHATLEAFLARLGLAFDRPARVYLVGETTQVFEGWREWNALLASLLPRFTSETLQQDPAEFRRKFKGLLQMWRAASSLSPPKINP